MGRLGINWDIICASEYDMFSCFRIGLGIGGVDVLELLVRVDF